jgi:hypothetical protein
LDFNYGTKLQYTVIAKKKSAGIKNIFETNWFLLEICIGTIEKICPHQWTGC